MIGLPEFDNAKAVSIEWILDLQKRLHWQDRRKVFLALTATMHALRDSLTPDEAVYLGAALPPLLRGFYYEGWHWREQPLPLDDRETFLRRLHEGLHREPGIDPELVARAVFRLLAERVPASELEDIRAASPAPLHGLWPS